MKDMQALFADFLVRTDLAAVPELAVSRAADAIIDCIGVSLAGSASLPAAVARTLVDVNSGEGLQGRAFRIGLPGGCTPSDAAFHNGVLAHALDFDDITHPANSHQSSSLVPALLAALPGVHPLDPRFLVAYVTGFEIAAKIGQIVPRSLRRDWHPTGVLGSIAVGAAVAKSMGVDHEHAVNALGVAVSASAGLAVQRGTMTKPFHTGHAAQAGLQAAVLAAGGFTASNEAYGPEGFLGVYAKEQARDRVDEYIGTLGQDWELCSEFGLALKLWPCCSGTHPMIEAGLRIHPQIRGHEVSSVYIGTTQDAPICLVYPLPETGLQGKFSAEYCVGTALAKGRVSLDTFRDESVFDEDVRTMMKKIHVQVDERVMTNTEHSAIVNVTLASGEMFEETVLLAKGKPERWLTEEDQRAKFLDCAQSVMDADRGEELYAALRDPDSVDGTDIARMLRFE